MTAAIVIYGFSFQKFLSPETMGSGANANLALMARFPQPRDGPHGTELRPDVGTVARTLSHQHALHRLRRGVQPGIDPRRGLTPFVATWLAQQHGAGSVGLYLALLSVVSLVALFISKETKFTNLDTMQTETATTGIESTSP